THFERNCSETSRTIIRDSSPLIRVSSSAKTKRGRRETPEFRVTNNVEDTMIFTESPHLVAEIEAIFGKNSEESRKNVVGTIPIPSDLFETDPEICRATFGNMMSQQRKATPEPAFGKQGRSLAATLATHRTDSGHDIQRPVRVLVPHGSTPQNFSQKNSCKRSDDNGKKAETHHSKMAISNCSQSNLGFHAEFDGQNRSLLPINQVKITSSETDQKATILNFSRAASNSDDSASAQLELKKSKTASDSHSLHSDPLESRLVAALGKADTDLQTLVASWPNLSSRIRETISALVAVSEHDMSDSQ
ncbi:MAG: hypothetical protein ACRCUY_04190, partial [Thermoguttaceae bacterium]